MRLVQTQEQRLEQQARLPTGGEGTELGWGARKVWKRKEGMVKDQEALLGLFGHGRGGWELCLPTSEGPDV